MGILSQGRTSWNIHGIFAKIKSKTFSQWLFLFFLKKNIGISLFPEVSWIGKLPPVTFREMSMFQAYVGIFLGIFGAALIFMEYSKLLQFSWMFPLNIRTLKGFPFPTPPAEHIQNPPFSIRIQSRPSPGQRNSRRREYPVGLIQTN